MAIACFDSSAFVKLLVEEDGSSTAENIWNACDTATASRLAYPEVRAALAAAGRAGRLDDAALTAAEDRWEEHWSSVSVIEVGPELARRAGGLAGEHSLRGADAVHLASLLALGDPTALLAVWDRRLRTGALSVGARLVPAHLPSPAARRVR